MVVEIVPALASGLFATAVMTAMMTMARKGGLTQMPSFGELIGAMVTGDPSRGPLFGNIVHWLMMGTVVFGIGYAVVVEAVDTAAWLVGLVTGMVHGLLVGAVAMPMMPIMHPRMGGRPRVSDGVVITSPGFFGLRWGAMTPLGIVMGHVVYGVVAATTYGALTV